MSIADWLPYPPLLYINVGFGLRICKRKGLLCANLFVVNEKFKLTMNKCIADLVSFNPTTMGVNNQWDTFVGDIYVGDECLR